MKKTFLYLAAVLFMAAGFTLGSCGSDKDDEPQVEIDNGIAGSKDIAGWAELPYLKLPQDAARIENHEKAVKRQRMQASVMGNAIHYFAGGKMSVIMGVAYGIDNQAGSMDPDELLLFVDNAKFEALLSNLGFQKQEKNDDGALEREYTSDKYKIVFQATLDEETEAAVKFLKTMKGLGKMTGIYYAYIGQ